MKIDDSLVIDAQGNGIYVIDGSLEVDGAFTFFTHDAYTVLVITGDFTAAHFQQGGDTQLIVLGKTMVAGYLRLDLSDAGFAAFRGAVTCTEWSQSNTDVEADLPTFAKKPKGTQRTAPDQSVEKLHKALAAGSSPFAVEAKTAGKKPKVISKAQLAAMTPQEALTCRGFVSAQVTAPVNANYFVKGEPGQPFKKVQLVDDVYFDEFPEELAELEELSLLGFNDAERTAAMLRSLPRLTGLKTLRLIDTSLATLPVEIAKLPQLEFLEIRENKNLTVLPAELGSLSSLRTLELLFNPKLKSLPVEFAPLKLSKLRINPALKKWPAPLEKLRKLAVEFY